MRLTWKVEGHVGGAKERYSCVGSAGKPWSHLGSWSGPPGWSSRFLGKTGGNKAEMVGMCQTVGGLGYPTKSLDPLLQGVGGCCRAEGDMTGRCFRKSPKGV